MAAVVRTKARDCTPVGYEFNDKVKLAVDVLSGDLLQYTGAMEDGLPVMTKLPAGELEADAVALSDGYAGELGFSIGVHGEIDGFVGAPGVWVYPSAAVAGGLDTDLPVGAPNRMKFVTGTRIRFMLV